MTEIAIHPCQEGYVSLEGSNIEPGWEEQAACRGVEQAIFLGKIDRQRPDKAICTECPVKQSCLMDSFAKSRHQVPHRRAGLLLEDRDRANRQMRLLFNRNATTYASDGYDGKPKAQFYTEDPRAPKLVEEYIEFQAELQEHRDAHFPLEDRPRWPTEAAIEIRDSA